MAGAEDNQKKPNRLILVALLIVLLGGGLWWISGDDTTPDATGARAYDPTHHSTKLNSEDDEDPEERSLSDNLDAGGNTAADESELEGADPESEALGQADASAQANPTSDDGSSGTGAQGVLAPGGAVRGAVRFSGNPPSESPIDTKSDRKCAELMGESPKTRQFELKDGQLAGVFVQVANPPPTTIDFPKMDPIVLDQRDCRYHPTIFGIGAKQPLEIVNSDPLLHNIHAMGKQEFNIGMPTQGQKITKKFKKAEQMVAIQCDVHPWMKAYAAVMSHPFFAVTAEDGSFVISGLPDGTYQLKLWHPRLNNQGLPMTSVSVRGGAAEPVEISLGQDNLAVN